MPLPADWETFVVAYRENEVYWYFPQGGTADTTAFRERLRVFQAFEGRTWTPALQREITQAMRVAGVSKSQSNALPRQLKRVYENLGLARIEEGEPIRITPAGRLYLGEEGRSKVLDDQVWRYQLPNPLNNESQVAGIEVFPHHAVIRLILSCDDYLTREEFVLFASRIRRMSDVPDAARRVRSWRAAAPAVRAEVRARLRNSRMGTIETNSSYSMAFHRCDTSLEWDSHSELRVRPGQRNILRRKLEERQGGTFAVTFADEPDYVAFHGDPDKASTALDALEHYIDRSDVPRAVAVFRSLPTEVTGGKTPEEFEIEQFLEKDLEDFLERNLHLIEAGLVREGKGRQHPTTVGIIDLFARDAHGDLVVIELKKGRAADKVFGQLCRYIGCIKTEYASAGQQVRGFIIGREIDAKLHYATKAVPPQLVKLKKFHRDVAATPAIWVEDALHIAPPA